ncbi:MAG: hypothetical protein ACI4KR_04465 [Ruminiclostridium sp.]
MKEFTFKCWMKAQMAKQDIKNGFKSLVSEEKGGADSLIIAIIIIVIVVAIGIIFRDQIGAWVSTLFDRGSQEINQI